jgi:hypothetical protein
MKRLKAIRRAALAGQTTPADVEERAEQTGVLA